MPYSVVTAQQVCSTEMVKFHENLKCKNSCRSKLQCYLFNGKTMLFYCSLHVIKDEKSEKEKSNLEKVEAAAKPAQATKSGKEKGKTADNQCRYNTSCTSE